MIVDCHRDRGASARVRPGAIGKAGHSNQSAVFDVVRGASDKRHVPTAVAGEARGVDRGERCRRRRRGGGRQRQPQFVVATRGWVGGETSSGQCIGADLGCAVAGVVEPLLVQLVCRRGSNVDLARPSQPLESARRRVTQCVERLDRASPARGRSHHRDRGGNKIAGVELCVDRNLRRCPRKKLRGDARQRPFELGDLSRCHFFAAFFMHLPMAVHFLGLGQPGQGLNLDIGAFICGTPFGFQLPYINRAA